MTVYERVENLRKDRHISQGKLEKELGFSNGSISKIKTSMPSADRLQKLADYFGVTMEYLRTGEDADKRVFSTDTALLLADLQFNEHFLEMAKMYRELSDKRQEDVLDYVKMLYMKK